MKRAVLNYLRITLPISRDIQDRSGDNFCDGIIAINKMQFGQSAFISGHQCSYFYVAE